MLEVLLFPGVIALGFVVYFCFVYPDIYSKYLLFGYEGEAGVSIITWAYTAYAVFGTSLFVGMIL